MKASRTKTQEIAMIIIYDAITYTSIGVEIDFEKLISNHLELPFELVDMFLKEIVLKSLFNKDLVISNIQDNMKGWKFNRINRLAQAILLLAVTHYCYIEKVDKKIVIDNAVRLAKKYLDDNDYKLINAVLEKTL